MSRDPRRLKTLITVGMIIGLCAVLVSWEKAPRAAPPAQRCGACHSVESLTASTSKYFEHYKTVHREVFRRDLSCQTCHLPFLREIKGTVKSASCAACHGSGKSSGRINSRSIHVAHLHKSGVTCASCHTGVRHRIDMVQLLDACVNCH